MSRGDKRYYVIFIYDFSRFTKLYFLRYRDDAFDASISYKSVENQLSRKIKRTRFHRMESMYLLMFSVKRKKLFMK